MKGYYPQNYSPNSTNREVIKLAPSFTFYLLSSTAQTSIKTARTEKFFNNLFSDLVLERWKKIVLKIRRRTRAFCFLQAEKHIDQRIMAYSLSRGSIYTWKIKKPIVIYMSFLINIRWRNVICYTRLDRPICYLFR